MPCSHSLADETTTLTFTRLMLLPADWRVLNSFACPLQPLTRIWRWTPTGAAVDAQVLRTKLLVTDDSFEFNRVLGRLKAMIAALPVVTAEDEQELQARMQCSCGTTSFPCPFAESSAVGILRPSTYMLDLAAPAKRRGRKHRAYMLHQHLASLVKSGHTHDLLRR